MKMMVIWIVIGGLGTISKWLVNELEDLKIRGQVKTYPDYSIIKISQNPEMSPGNLLSPKLQCENLSKRGKIIISRLIDKFISSLFYGCRIQRDWTPPNECPIYDSKQSGGEASVMLELWGMQSTPSLPSLPGPLWPGVLAPNMVLSMG